MRHEWLTRISLAALAILCFLVPGAVFTGAVLPLSLAPRLSGLAVVAPAPLVLAEGFIAWHSSRRKDAPAAAASWVLVLLVTTLVAWTAAVVAGGQNHAILVPYYDISARPLYTNVDPNSQSGELLMDAGRIVFKAGTHVDVAKAMGFKDGRTYCVAPVAVAAGSSYDFWAVGTDCCGSPGGDQTFRCGAAADRLSTGGLRLLGDDQARGFYRLAVQQAEATFGITAVHPLFFDWRRDPVGEVNALWDKVLHRLTVQVPAFWTLQLFVVLTASTALAKLEV